MGNCSPRSGWVSTLNSDRWLVEMNDLSESVIENPSQHNLIDPDSPRDIGYFIHGTEKLHWKQVRSFLSKRYDILEEVTKLQSFKVTKVLQSDFLDMRLVPFLLFAWAVVSSRPRTIDITLEHVRIRTTQNYPTLLMKRVRLYIKSFIDWAYSFRTFTWNF